MLATLLQQAAQIPIHVIVDQTPAGMSEWQKTLLSASVGAVIGFLSSMLTDYVKTSATKRDLKRKISHQIDDELLDNLSNVDSATRILAHAKDKEKQAQVTACIFALPVVMDIKQDRYDHFLKEEIASVYDLDDKKYLRSFYGFSKDKAIALAREYKFHELIALLSSMGRIGHFYIEDRKLTFRQGFTVMEDVYIENLPSSPTNDPAAEAK